MNRPSLLLIALLITTFTSFAQGDFIEEKESKIKSRFGIGANVGVQMVEMGYLNDAFEKRGSVGLAKAFPAIEAGLSISGNLDLHWAKNKRFITSIYAGHTQASSKAQYIDTTGEGNVHEVEIRPVDFNITAAISYKIVDAKRLNFQLGAGVSYHVAFLLHRDIVNTVAAPFNNAGGSANIGVMADAKIEFYLLNRLSIVAAAGYQYAVIKELKNEAGEYLGDGHVELDFSGANLMGGVRLYLF